MKFRDVEGFVGVDVAQPGEKRLVEQQRLELAMFFVQRGVKPLRSEVLAEGFGSEDAEEFLWVYHEPHASELACIVEYQRPVP